ncbi:hypothetical protein Lal_00020432 [Lupinus albus]|uniref:Uncharacterized protein n=1 Tax=Lupinus albus TaxID=3870 RepID=A0A6A5MGS6_LUPAL|nr:hypothetical protein Lalb_Chr08g0240831 [Lupinus albus]KAF1871638.1 hypothetical protein Lal_00020432 [Lupinus albus]
MSNQTENKGKMENPSATLPPRPPLSRALEKQPSFDEHGPKTMSAKDLKLAREEALKMFSAQNKGSPKEIMEKKVTTWKKAKTSGCMDV